MKKVKDIVFNIIIGALLVFVFIQVVFPDQGMKIFGFRTFIVADTKSMEPNLYYPDFIVVTKGDYENLREKSDVQRGDYIAFYNQDNLPVTHEIINKKYENGKTYYETQGTNNIIKDKYYTSFENEEGYNKYIGKYAFKIPYLGNIIVFLRSLPGVIFLLVNFTAIGVVVYVFKKYDKLKE